MTFLTELIDQVDVSEPYEQGLAGHPLCIPTVRHVTPEFEMPLSWLVAVILSICDSFRLHLIPYENLRDHCAIIFLMKQHWDVLIKNTGLEYIHTFPSFSRTALIPSIFSTDGQGEDRSIYVALGHKTCGNLFCRRRKPICVAIFYYHIVIAAPYWVSAVHFTWN